jgi:hypothetical protein
MASVDETLRVEKFKIDNYLRMGYSIYDAMLAVDNNIDWHEVERLIAKGCKKDIALRIA